MRKKQRLLTLIIALCVICNLNSIIAFGSVLQPVSESDDTTTTTNVVTDSQEDSKMAEKILQNDARKGIVKIVTGYEFQDTSFDLWTVGYGFLITKEHVITSRNVAVIDKSSSLYRSIVGTRGEMYARLGINLNDYQTTIKQVRTYIILDEGKVEAQTNPNAIGDSFAVLDLSQRINSKDVLVLSEEPMEDDMKIYAIGPKEIDNSKKITEVKPAQKMDFFGKLSTVTKHRKSGFSEYVEFKGNFQTYILAAGCPLITKDQVVVGMITDGVKGNGSAVDIQTIENELDKANIEYSVVKPDQPNPDTPNADPSIIEKLLADISTIDRSVYTKESLAALDEQVKISNEMLAERSVSANRIDKQYQSLSNAYAGLIKVDHSGFYKKIVIIAVVIIVVIVIIIFALRMIHNIGKDEFEIEDEKLERQAEKERRKQEKKAKNHTDDKSSKQNEEVVNSYMNNGNENNSADEDKTGVLNEDDGQTGVLNERTTKAWLVHESGNRITVNKNRFIIGKAQGVDYRINNNTVSRNHCRILTRGNEFFIEDLGSTNGTFIDGERLNENVPAKLSNGQKITLSDENFTFEISGGS